METRARICKPCKEPRNRFPAWRNRFLGSINVYKYGLKEKAWVYGRNDPACSVGVIAVMTVGCIRLVILYATKNQQQYLELPSSQLNSPFQGNWFLHSIHATFLQLNWAGDVVLGQLSTAFGLCGRDQSSEACQVVGTVCAAVEASFLCVHNSPIVGCSVAQSGCSVPQLVARWLAVRQARVLISARQPIEVLPAH